MKHLKFALMTIAVIFCITTVNAQTKKSKTVKHQHTMAYQCPMKCEGDKTYAKAGKCPVCNMQMKSVTKQAGMAAMYQCPVKCEGDKTYDKAGKCPKCGMDLKAMKQKKGSKKEAEMKM